MDEHVSALTTCLTLAGGKGVEDVTLPRLLLRCTRGVVGSCTKTLPDQAEPCMSAFEGFLWISQ